MGFKTGLFIGAAAGYVLGTKAGRERYQQIMDGCARFCGDDRFQAMACKGKAVVEMAAERVKGAVTDQFGDEDTKD
jgi:hypothetical protein